jgi:hypothetical protein
MLQRLPDAPYHAALYAGGRSIVFRSSPYMLDRMQKAESPQLRRRESISAEERQRRREATTENALAAIKAEAEARRLKTERLRAAREAAPPQNDDDAVDQA